MNERRQKLNDSVVGIELTLLSVIQGVALYFLADNARGVLVSLDYGHWIYVFIGFILLCTFWAQAIVHVLSFISWPIEFRHNFLYFALIISEVLMFQSLTNPLHWFAASAVFFAVAGVLYYADLKLLESKKGFFNSEKKRDFYEINMSEQKIALFVLVPIGFAFAIASVALIILYPETFLLGQNHLILACIQAFLGTGTLLYLLNRFDLHLSLIETLE